MNDNDPADQETLVLPGDVGEPYWWLTLEGF